MSYRIGWRRHQEYYCQALGGDSLKIARVRDNKDEATVGQDYEADH